MSGSEYAAPSGWPSYFTGEYARLGVSVNGNMGLSAPVLVNVLTGVMHAATDDGATACDMGNDGRTLVLPESMATLRSLSSVAFRACRNCEKIVKANAKLCGGTSAPATVRGDGENNGGNAKGEK